MAELDLSDFDAALGPLTAGDNGTHALAPPIGDRIPEHTRNATLTSLAGSARRRGVSEAGILALLQAENTRCDPPLPERELTTIARSVGRYEPAAEPSVMVSEHLTDLGNARRLVSRHGPRFRWCETWGCFVVWDGARWVRDDHGQVMRWAKDTVKALYAEASDMADEAQRKALVQHALRSESDGKLRAMVNLAKSEESIPIAPDAFDRDPWVFNVRNGTLDLRTGAIREHRPEDFLTKLAPVVYDPTATAPVFQAFLARIFDGKADLVGYAQEALGYSLTGQTVEQCWFLLHGIGANGKSTLLRTIIDLLADYATWTPTQTLLAKRGEGIDNDLARLRGARFVGATETDGGRRLAEELVKRMTGGDKVAARFLYGEFFEFAPEFKLWLATNHKPEIRGTDHATWRRVRLVPFTVTIPDAEQDKQLLEKLRGEFPGILRWMVEGCLSWQRDGLRQPDAVTQATREYRASMDVVGNFLTECCANDPHGTVKAADLYKAYLAWCDSGKEHAESQRKFGEVLRERGYSHGTRATGGATTWKGLRLGSEGSEGSEPLFGNF